MKGLLALTVLVAIGFSASAQQGSGSVRQTISITVVDHMDVKVEKRFSKTIKSEELLSTTLSTDKKNTVTFSNVINSSPEEKVVVLPTTVVSGPSLATVYCGQTKDRMLMHTITAL